MTDIEEDLDKYRVIPCSWSRRVNIFTWSTICNLINRFNAISIKILKQVTLCDKVILKFIRKAEKPRIADIIVNKEKKVRVHTTLPLLTIKIN